MQRRRIYAHWLDPEYLSDRWLDSQVAARRFELLGLLKMRAILGDTLCLSDVQVNDSRLVFELFSDPQFQAFVEKDRDFLRLVSRPTDVFSAATPKLAVIESGFGRVRQGWSSSTFSSPHIHETLAGYLAAQRPSTEDDFRNAFRLSQGKLDALLRRLSDTERQLVRGMVQGLDYFCAHPECVEVCTTPPTSYYKVLLAAEGGSSTPLGVKNELADVLRFIESNVQGDDRHKRTPAINVLAENIQRPENFRRYINILQAWNVSVANSVNPTHHSGYYLPGTAPVAFLFGDVSEFLVTVGNECSDHELFTHSERRSWHPQGLSWTAVGSVRDRCRAEILAYQAEPENATKWDKLREEIAKVVTTEGGGADLIGHSTVVVPAQMSPPWITGGPEAGNSAGLLGRFGNATKELWGAPELVKLIGWCSGHGSTFSLISILMELHKRATRGIRERKTYDELDSYAVRYNLKTPRSMK